MRVFNLLSGSTGSGRGITVQLQLTNESIITGENIFFVSYFWERATKSKLLPL